MFQFHELAHFDVNVEVYLMDIQMSELDGVEAPRAIRFKDRFEAGRGIPSIG
jgi:CheY-like chemotaxis protein